MRRICQNASGFLRNEDAAVAVMFALLAPVLIGLSALAVDISYYRSVQNQLQTAADAAALAAVVKIETPDVATAVAVDYASRNVPESYGVVTTADDVDLGSWHPATRTFAAATGSAVNAVRVRAERTTARGNAPSRFLGRIFGEGAANIGASAVAVWQAGGTGCVLALSQTATPGILVTGSSGSTLTLCDMVSNAAGVGFEMSGMGSSVSAQCIQTHGTAVVTENLTVTCATLRQHAGIVADPFADIAEPAEPTGTCQPTDVGQNNVTTTVTASDPHPSGMLSRRYCNGMNIRGTTTFSPGLYWVKGGDIIINSNANISGSGVVFYLAPGNHFRFNGTAKLNLSAPTTGPYAGLIIFASRATDDTGTSNKHFINGNLGSHLDGAIYATNSHLTVSGNAATSGNSCTQIVTSTVEFTGNGQINVNCDNPAGANIDLPGRVMLVR